MTAPSPDRLRELLDAVLDEEHHSLDEMAGGAHVSVHHFTRQLTAAAGEPPVAMRRRVMLERAAWQLADGASVTDAAFAAGYESVEGFGRAFARAYGHPPSALGRGGGGGGGGTDDRAARWLPAPNGVHFHPPVSLWVDSTRPAAAAVGGGGTGSEVTALLVHHDVDDVQALLEAAKGLTEDELSLVRLPGHAPLGWDGADETLGQVLAHLVLTKEVWLAAIEGRSLPERGEARPVDLLARHEEAGARWLALARDVERRGAWGDRLVDALCDPPESFVLGSVVAHVLTFSAHRRQVARLMLRQAGLDADGLPDPDPIMWARRRAGGLS